MRILSLIDIAIKEEQLDRAIKKIFPEAIIRYIKWPPVARDVFSKENLNIERKGPEVGMPIPGIIETVNEFDPEVMITHFAPVTGEVIEKSKSLEMIGCLRGGVENINLEATTKRNILVFNNAGRTANAVAEFTVAHMLAITRNTSIGYHALQNGQWFRPETQPSEIYGSTVGLIGFGNVSNVRFGKFIQLEIEQGSKSDSEIKKEIEYLCDRLLSNPIIEDFRFEIID
jgi:D-3-phosphoglycerate dehydrogenase